MMSDESGKQIQKCTGERFQGRRHEGVRERVIVLRRMDARYPNKRPTVMFLAKREREQIKRKEGKTNCSYVNKVYLSWRMNLYLSWLWISAGWIWISTVCCIRPLDHADTFSHMNLNDSSCVLLPRSICVPGVALGSKIGLGGEIFRSIPCCLNAPTPCAWDVNLKLRGAHVYVANSLCLSLSCFNYLQHL